MTTMLDPVTALVSFLKADTDVAALTGGRVFGSELPDSQNANMPRAAVVCRQAGSPNTYGGGYQDFGDIRVECRCYSSTPYEAVRVSRAVYGALKMMRRNIQGSTILHWARPAGGMQTLRDPDTEWPFSMSSWQILAAEQA